MDIVLGVSLTPKTVRMVLVEGVKGDGAIVDHDDFDVSSSDGSATASVADQVVAAVVGTQESAAEGGHELAAIGVTWSDRTEAAQLRDALAAKGVRDVVLVSELHAAGALAQAAGKAVGYDGTALLFIDRDSATLAVVHSEDGSIVKVDSRDLHSTDAMAVLAGMVASVEALDTPPQGMFVVGSGVDISSVREHLEGLVSLPVHAPDESALALARGAALAAASAPVFDATTAGLAYSQDPDGLTSGNDYVGLANAATMMRPAGGDAPFDEPYELAAYDHAPYDQHPHVEEGRKPFLLVGSALTSIFVVGVIALVISLAVSIRPTVSSRPDAGEALIPQAAAPAAPPPPEAQVPAPAPEPEPAPPPETIKAPVPVVQQQPQAPPRTVYVEQPQAPAPAPEALPPAPAPEAPAPAPAFIPPPIVAPPPIWQPPVWQPPVWQPPAYNPPQWQPSNPWQQQQPRRGRDDDWPGQGGRGNDWPGQGGNGGRGNDWPGQGGRGGGGNGGGGNHGCFLIFCR